MCGSLSVNDLKSTVHAREPLSSNSADSLLTSRGGCSRRVHKIVYLAGKKSNILVNILLLKLFIADYCHL